MYLNDIYLSARFKLMYCQAKLILENLSLYCKINNLISISVYRLLRHLTPNPSPYIEHIMGDTLFLFSVSHHTLNILC